jgi:hypothetical protein
VEDRLQTTQWSAVLAAGRGGAAVDDIFAVGAVAAMRGDRAEALRWLTEAVDHGYKGHHDLDPMGNDEDLNSLHGDPAFEALVARVKERAR